VIQDLIAASVVLSLLLSMLIGFSYVQKRWRVDPEITRKSVHIGMGLITLTFPWIFSSKLTVVILAVIAIISLLLIRQVKAFNSQAGAALGKVDRNSFGEIYFPVSVALVFDWSNGDVLLYVIPILILTFADALAALVGKYFGRLFFTTPDGLKTIEGSAAFLVVAVICISLPLLFLSDMDFFRALQIALLLGLLVMFIEAISWSGLDNLFIPVCSFMLFDQFTQLDSFELLLHLFLLVFLFLALFIWRHFGTLRNEAILAATLYGYFAWTIGGGEWLLIAFVTLVIYPFLSPERKTDKDHHGMHVIFFVAGSGLIWLMLSKVFELPNLFFVYTFSFSLHLVMIGIVRYKAVKSDFNQFWLAVMTSVKGAVVVFTPYLMINTGDDYRSLIFAFAIMLLVVAIFMKVSPRLHDYKESHGLNRWYLQTGLVFSGCVLSLIPHYFLMELA